MDICTVPLGNAVSTKELLTNQYTRVSSFRNPGFTWQDNFKSLSENEFNSSLILGFKYGL